MNKKQKAKLKKTVEMGKWNYVLRIGVLYFGGITFIFLLFMDFIEKRENIPLDFIAYPLICIILGLIFGLWAWNNINKRFKGK